METPAQYRQKAFGQTTRTQQTNVYSGGSSGAKAYREATANTSPGESPQEYRERVEAQQAAQQQPTTSPSPSQRSLTGLDMLNPNNPADNRVIQQRVQAQQQQMIVSKGSSSPKIQSGPVREYPTPYNPEYIKQVEMGQLAAMVQPQATRRDIIAGQNTLSYIPGQRNDRIRDEDRQEAAQAMALGRFEPAAARYESNVANTLAPLTGSGYKSARFAGGVLEAIAYTPTAIPRLAKGIVTNPTATIRETALGIPETVIDDPARGIGQVVGMVAAGKLAGKSVKVAGDAAGKIKVPEFNAQGMKALLADETASAKYWQVKYDFSKARINAFESEVPQIQPGVGLVSGKPYSGLHPILEAKINAQSAGSGVKAVGDMSALERFQASGRSISTPVEVPTVKQTGSLPVIKDTAALNKLLQGEKVSFQTLPDIEPTGKLVGIKRSSGKPLSEVPDNFLTSRGSSSSMWQADVKFKQPVLESSNIPQLQKAPMAAKPKPVTFKEPAPSTLNAGELARLQRLIDGENMPAVKSLPKTSSAVFTAASVAAVISTASMTNAKTMQASAVQTSVKTNVLPVIDVKTLIGTSVSPQPQAKPVPSAQAVTSINIPNPVISPSKPRKIPPLDFDIDIDTGLQKSLFDPNIGIKRGSRKNRFGDVNEIIFGR